MTCYQKVMVLIQTGWDESGRLMVTKPYYNIRDELSIEDNIV